MKKISIPLFLSLLLFLLSACSEASGTSARLPEASGTDETIFQGKVLSVQDGSLLLGGTTETDGEVYRLSLEGLELEGIENASEIQAGALIEVTFDGFLSETWPAGFSNPQRLAVTGQEEDLTGFYLQIIADLLQRDAGLNEGIHQLAFDLNAAENLSAAEKNALIWLAGEAWGVESFAATLEELQEQGRIDPESLTFEDGLAISFQDMEFSQDRFTFSVKKWRGPLGAYVFFDCVAEKSGNSWTYQIGAEMIS